MRGSRKRGLFRRRLAGFLAACLVVTNLQGLTFAYGAETEIVEEKARLIQLDMSAVQAAVQEAAENGVLITAPEMTASAANAQELPFADPAYELSPGNIEALLTEGTELPGDTSLRIFLEPLEEPGENDSYVITGDEQLIFLIENDSNEAQAYQIQFGDKVTGLIVAESRKELRKELNGEEEEELAGGAGGSGSAEAPTEESSEAVTEPGTEESSQAETEESTESGSEAETEESSEESSESETGESTQESSEAVTEPSTEESSQSETTTEAETPESTEAETEESSDAESAPESSAEETTAEESQSGSESAEESIEAAAEAPTEEMTEESTEAAAEEESDVPEEGQVAPENESPVAALWQTTVNFLTGSITAYAAETATPPEATETEPESESENIPESQDDADNQGASGSEGGSGSAGGSGSQDDTDIPVATDGNADKKPKKEKVFTEADGLDSLTTLDIDAVNVLIDGGLKRADGEAQDSVFALFEGEGEKSVAMFALPLSVVLAVENSNFTMTLYDYSGTGTNAGQINAYLAGKGDPFRFGSGQKDPWNAWDITKGNKKEKVNIYQGIVADTIGGEEFPHGKHLKTNLFPGSNVKYDGNNVIKRYPISNPEDIFTRKSNGYYVYDSKETPVQYASGKLKWTEDDAYKNVKDSSIQENLPGGFWPFTRNNFYHGMKFSFNFSLLADGKAQNPETGTRDDMIFKFAGDDDVWVYLTDLSDDSESRLVLDVGGNHNSMTGTINFATGVVQYERTTKEGNAGTGGTVVYGTEGEAPKAYLYTYEDWKEDYPKDWWMSDRWLQNEFNKAYPLGSMGLKRKDLAQYRLDFYYLERGGNASNCYLEFNTPVVEKDKITVAKKVVSDNTELLNGTYEFELQVPGKEKEQIFVEVKEGYGTKDSNAYTLNDENTTFTLKEVAFWDENGVQKPTRIEWLNSAGEVVSENLTAEGTLGEDTLLMCVNYYDNLAPHISKQANLKKPGYYDLVLGVQGAEISSTVDGETTVYKAKNITAADTLSEHVAFDLKDGKPQIQLEEADGQRTEAVVTPNGDGWSVSAGDQKIADIAGKEITWYVTEENATLGAEETKKLHIAIEVTAPYKANYDEKDPMPDEGTGTHADIKERGYYSNQNEAAKVTYQTEISEKVKELYFPKPVVRPAEPSGTLTLTKQVTGVSDFKGKFDFTIELDGILKDTVSVKYPGKDAEWKNVQNGSLTLSDIQLGDQESIVISGLNQGVTYTITEGEYTDDFYTSEVTGGAVTRTGTLEGDHASVSVTYTNNVSAKPAMTLEKVVSDSDGVLNGTSETYKFVLEKVHGNQVSAVVDGFAVYQVNESQKEPVEVDTNGRFALAGAGQLLLVFEESFDMEASYRIREVEAGTANSTSWKTGDGQGESGLGTTTDLFKAANGKQVTFTNIYHNNTLTIEKKLAEDSYKPESDAAKTFKFTVTFKDKNDQPLERVGYDAEHSKGFVFGKEVVVNNGNITLTNGSVTFDLVAGNQLVLDKIPAGTSYTVTENGWADENLSLAYYENALVKVEHNGLDKGTKNPVDGRFEGAAKNQTVSFTNRIFVIKGTLQIRKQIVDENGDLIQLEEKEARTFRFKIEQLGTNDQPNGMVIYKTITVTPKSSKEGVVVTLEVPAGKYRITELETIKYQTVSPNPQDVMVTGGADTAAEVIFKNHKPADKYFTDVAVAVNTIENTSSENEPPKYEYKKQPEALPSNKENDDTVE